MTRAELDYILGAMLDSHKEVSDLNFTVDQGQIPARALAQLETAVQFAEINPVAIRGID